jgi:predicted  nucleic acid-binding Zn-ribbon protein
MTCATCGKTFDAFFDNSLHACPECYWNRFHDAMDYATKDAYLCAMRDEYARAFGQTPPDPPLALDSPDSPDRATHAAR